MDKHDGRIARKASILSIFDPNLIVSYLKIAPFKRTDQMLEYLKLLLMKMKISTDVVPTYLENCIKELAIHYKLLQKQKNECILTNPCDFYIILTGELHAQNDLLGNMTLGEGAYIGENCLLLPKISQYRIICSQSTTFAYISLKNFHDICFRYSQAQLELSAKELRQIPSFSDWSQKKLLFLSSCFKLVCLDRHSYLFKEGEPCEFVYIVKTGEVELVKSMPGNAKKPVNFGKHGRPINLPEVITSKTNFHCSIKTQFEIIGEEEANNDFKWKSSCKCYSFICVLYRISKAEYKKYMRVEESKQNWKEKTEIVKKRMQKSIPILNSNKRCSSLPLPSAEVKMKILNNIKKIDPWNMKNHLVLTTRSSAQISNKRLSHENQVYQKNICKSSSHQSTNIKFVF